MKLETKELRLGNDVIVNDIVYAKVTGIFDTAIKFSRGDGWTGQCSIDLVKPIPITEELIIKEGYTDLGGEFEKHVENPWKGNKSKFSLFLQFYNGDGHACMIINEESDLDKNYSFVPKKIEYIHQLQNLIT